MTSSSASRLAFGAALASVMLSPSVQAAPASRRPAPAKVEPVVDTIHGVAVKDPYRWLEDGDSADVARFTDEQNAYMRATLDAVPARSALEARLWQLHEIGSLGVPVRRGKGPFVRYFYTRRTGKQNQPVLYVRDGAKGRERTLVDLNALAADGTRSIDWWFPSEDGRLVAYGVSEGGDEESVLRVRDVATGEDLPDVIPRTRACSIAWRPDGKGFWYTRYPAPGTVPAAEEKYHREVFFHTLGADPTADPHVFGRGRDMTDWPSVALSPNGRWLVVEVSQGWAKSEVFLIDATSAKEAAPVAIVEGVNAIFNVTDVLDDRVYILTNDGAPRYRLYEVNPRKPSRASWKEIIPESDETLEGALVVGGKLATLSLKDASSRVRLYDRKGQRVRELALPGLGTVASLSGRPDADELFFGFASYLVPTKILRHDVRRATDRVWAELPNPINADAFEVEQERFVSKDGTSVPMFLVHKKGLRRDGKNRTLLYGYGGFNISLTPAFAASVAPFIEAGGVYAVANLRGGAEYGETWHQAGMLAKKQNVFDDFIAAAEHLVRTGVTSPAHLAISGRSNGGLLTGAALTQRPDLFRAVVSGVPLLDMVRYHRFRIAKLWIPEYGDPDKPDEFKWLYAYSPYHRVKDGTPYPAVLVFTAASDTRVDAMHARKMVARLQAATSSKHPILLRLETRAGHGAGKPIGKLIAQYTDELAFLFSELGLDLAPPAPARAPAP